METARKKPVRILISDKIDFKPKRVKRDNKEYYILIIGKPTKRTF